MLHYKSCLEQGLIMGNAPIMLAAFAKVLPALIVYGHMTSSCGEYFGKASLQLLDWWVLSNHRD